MIGIADPVSTLTHALGAIVFAVLTIPLLRGTRIGHRFALGVFAVTVVGLLSASTTFHLLPHDTPVRAVFKRIDHAAIFALIAGTFTSYHAILFRGVLRWGAITFIWVAAAAGITLKTVFFTSVPEWLGISLYLAMGWCGALTMVGVWRTRDPKAAAPIIAAGVAYTLGAVVEFTSWPTIVPGVVGSHEVFHVFVLIGAGIFWAHVAHFSHASRLPPVGAAERGEPEPLAETVTRPLTPASLTRSATRAP